MLDENIRLKKVEIPALIQKSYSLYDHLPPETKQAYINLDQTISDKKTTCELLEYKNEKISEKLRTELEGMPLKAQLVNIMAELELAKEKHAESKKVVKKYYDIDDEENDVRPMRNQT